MSKTINTNFTVYKPAPIDSRTQVSTYAGLANIAVKYIGLKVYVVDEDQEYRYYSTGWQVWDNGSGGGGGAAVWGSITGTLADQSDLNSALLLKFDKTGGTISGATLVQSTVTASDFLIYGTGQSVTNPYPQIVDPPALATSVGAAGQIAYDASYFYMCVATNTWVRAALTTW